jgi:probable rRNA maturation factor
MSVHEITVVAGNHRDFAAQPLEHAALATLHRAGHDQPAAITIVLESDEVVQALNLQYRGVDAPTDVLSFPAATLPVGMLGDDEVPPLGDLMIAMPYTRSLAAILGHTLADVLALLVTHGTLHLLGYTHDTPEEQARMWAIQQAVLTDLGVRTDVIPALESVDH